MARPWYKKLFSRSSARKPKLETEEREPVELECPEPQLPPAGSVAAQFALGLGHANAPGSNRNYEQAAAWYFKAATRNHPLAQFNLGVMFNAGQGVPRNPTEAERWFRKAAQQGDAGAQHRMGLVCERASFRGIGAAEAKIEAYKWYTLAAAQGYAGSNRARLKLTLWMAREQVTEGARRAAGFTAETQPNPDEPEELTVPALDHGAEAPRS